MAPSMALFPPGKGGGEGVARGGKGKGMLIHSLTEGGGMPLANRTTPAKGDERAQVRPLLDAVKIRTGKRGRPRKRLRVIATEKGYDAKALRAKLRKRGIRAQSPKGVWKTKKPQGKTDKASGAAIPSRAHLCLVPEEVSSFGGALGAACRVLRGIPDSRHDSHLGP